ncbi:MAG: DUF1569 domain-containing protein [Gammaproteobacteria bacterium]|nr:DUF1569 domain-containing protein [Gammaproteobacteria bacterium]
MKRLADDRDLEELAARIRKLKPDSRGLWGHMSFGQMVCHLADSFRRPLGKRPASPRRDTWFTRTVLKWIILRTALQWRGGAPTSPDIDQVAGKGTPPGEFSEDVAILLDLMRQFIAQGMTEERPSHPLFGQLTWPEWTRWGWAHVDLHLRQFGA